MSLARSPVALLRLFIWLTALGAGVALLHGLGGGALEAPPHSPGARSSWWAGSDPVVATMALLRLVVLGLGWYLLVATVLGLLAHLSRSVMLWRLAELVTARSMRELVAGLVGIALVSATSAPASATPTLGSNDGATPIPIQLVLQQTDDREVSTDVGGGGSERAGPHEPPEEVRSGEDGAGAPDRSEEVRPGEDDDTGPQDPAGEARHEDAAADPAEAGQLPQYRQRGGPLTGPGGPGVPVDEDLVDDPPTDGGVDRGSSELPGGADRDDASGTREGQDPADPGPLADALTGSADPSPPGDAASPTSGSESEEHVVVAGESFWLIASALLAQAGEPTDDRTVERYWRVLIEANHDRLVVQGEPDLILPGQRLRVPPISSVVGSGVAP